jgi:O-antigen ligase
VIQLLAVARAERVRVLKWLSLRLAAGMVVVAAVVLISSQDITSYWQALVTYQEQKTLFEGREFVLSRAVEGIRANPVTGYLEVGMEEEFAHNTFLDAGAYAGMPGLVLFAILTLFPLIFAFRKQGLVVCGPVLSEYLLALYAMLSLSLMYYKVFWVTWSILLYYAHRGSAVTTVARAPALLRAPPVSGTA